MPSSAIRLLGGVTLLDAEGCAAVGPAVQRHRLALLAILAVAAPGGVQRDRLLGLLWPEREPEAARNLLRVALHALRQTLGHDALPGVGREVRLDPARVAVDVHAFERALADGDPAGAVARYGGPFCDGLFLDGAEAFDEWMEGHRRRLAGRYAEALEALATDAEGRGDHRQAADRWRTLAAAAPHDGRIARRCVDALAASGDVTGALAHARAHVRHLRDALGLPPDRALVERVRTLAATLAPHDAVALADDLPGAPVERPAAPPASAPSPPEPAAPEPADPGPADPEPAARAAPVSSVGDFPVEASPADAGRRARPAAPARPTTTPVRWRVAGLLAATVAVVALVIAGGAFRRGVTAPPGARADAPTVVAIGAFEAVGAVPGGLHDGLPALLAATLDQVPELRPTRPPAFAGAAPADTLGVLRVVGASLLVGGVVRADGDSLVATATLVDTTGAARARLVARARVGDPAALVDALALSILRHLWGRQLGVPEPRLAAVGTTSATALRAYLRGEAFLRAARWDSAAAALAEAVDADSTFALAQFRLAEPYGWRYGMGHPVARRALAAAQRHADRLPPRERLLLAVRLLHENGDLAAVDRAAALTERYPGDAEARYVAADVRYHAATAAGLQARLLATAAFDTALALDTASVRVLAHPVSLALELGDRARFRRHSTRLLALGGGSHIQVDGRPDFAFLDTLRFGTDPAAVPRLLAARLARAPLPAWQVAEVVQAIAHATLDGPTPDPAALLAAYDVLDRAYRSTPAVAHELAVQRGCHLMQLGRLDAGRSVLRAEALPGCAVDLVALGLAPPRFLGPIDDPGLDGSPADRRRRELDRASLALARGDAATARAHLRRAGAPPAAPDDTIPRSFVGPLEAAAAWALLLDGDTAAAIRRWDVAERRIGYDGAALQRSVAARVVRLHVLATRVARRPEVVDRLLGERLPMLSPSRALITLELARTLALMGDAAGAERERRRFAAMWRAADPEARALADRLLPGWDAPTPRGR